MTRKLLILLTLTVLAALPARAQYYQTGSNPSGTRWNHISGEHFEVIYPREIDSLAREFLFAFERDRAADLAGLRIQSERVPMILHPYDMYSNGTVVWAPKRVELMTTPPFEALYPMDWETQLSTHEGRHLGQMAHYTRGIYRVLMFLTGEQGIGVGVGLYPSKTLLEGDAVQNETDLTGAGRGRNPEFLKFYHASFLEKDFRKYDDWRYGSYHRYNPSKYAFGYMINSTMRDNSGNYFVTGDIMAEQVRSWWRFFSVSHRSYIRASGLTTRKNWRLAVSRYTQRWDWEYKTRAPYTISTALIPERPKYYTEFDNPLLLPDGLYATMAGLQDERHLVRIDSLGDHHRRHTLSGNTSSLAADGDGALFSEIIPDPRWEHRSWSVIRRYDATTNRVETLTRKTRYVNPVPAGDAILAIDYKVTGGSDIVVLDREGHLTDRIAAPAGTQALNAARLGETLYVSALSHEGAAIYRLGETGWKAVLGPQKKSIRDMRPAGDSLLYFISDLDGISNVYAYRPDEDEEELRFEQWTTVPVSAAHPFLGEDGSLYVSNYDALGYRPVRVDADSLDRKDASFFLAYEEPTAGRNSRQATGYIPPRSEEREAQLRADIDSLESHPYSKVLHGIHIHSWFPFYADPDRIINDIGRFNLDNWYRFIAPGATVISQNNLGTLAAILGYSWRQDKGMNLHGAHLNLSYSGLYPVFEVAVDYNDRPRQNIVYELDQNSLRKMTYSYERNALTAVAMAYVPLNLSRGGWNRQLTPQLSYSMTNDRARFEYAGKTLDIPVNQLLRTSISYYSMLSQPAARIRPRLGLGLSVSGQLQLGVSNLEPHWMNAVNVYGYLPGFGKEDNFKLTYNYQQQGGSLLTTQNMVKLPRGYNKDEFILKNYHGFSLDYALPINTDGISGGWLFYFKRLQLIPFVDYGFDADQQFFSYGGAALVNTQLFRIGKELRFGVQYARTMEGGRGQFKFVLSSGF